MNMYDISCNLTSFNKYCFERGLLDASKEMASLSTFRIQNRVLYSVNMCQILTFISNNEVNFDLFKLDNIINSKSIKNGK